METKTQSQEREETKDIFNKIIERQNKEKVKELMKTLRINHKENNLEDYQVEGIKEEIRRLE